jgi:DNA modification methylase
MNCVIVGDVRQSLRELRALDVKVQCCVTSPPYFGLRDYGHPGQIGLEKTPADYVAAMVEVFRLVWDVLADDGVLWLNLGDSYNAYNANRGPSPSISDGSCGRDHPTHKKGLTTKTLKNKDLIGIPWRVAFALQENGWYLRQDIIWHKPNPMPESVRDRCTKAHEYVFMLTKNARYYWDADAMKEPCSDDMQRRAAARHTRGAKGKIDSSRCDANTLRGEHAKVIDVSQGRNRRSVWTIPPKPYKGAHFAVMPPALVEPCILASSRPGDIVLDPFFGSGTTGSVAVQHGRQYLGCELNSEYRPLWEARIADALT